MDTVWTGWWLELTISLLIVIVTIGVWTDKDPINLSLGHWLGACFSAAIFCSLLVYSGFLIGTTLFVPYIFAAITVTVLTIVAIAYLQKIFNSRKPMLIFVALAGSVMFFISAYS